MVRITFCMLYVYLFTLLCSCQTVIKKIYGVRSPDYETTEMISVNQKKWFGTDYPVISLRHQAWVDKYTFHVPDVLVFDSLGRHIPFRDPGKPNCNGPAEQFLAELSPSKTYYTDESFSRNMFTGLLAQNGCDPVPYELDPGAHFYVFMTWAGWTGRKIYRDKTVRWMEVLHGNNKAVSKVILVNMDLQACWTREEKEMVESAQTW